MYINKTILNDNQGNALRLSKVQQLDGDIKFNGFSAKFVISGEETYFVNKKKFVLRENEFIIGNNSLESTILIDTKISSKGWYIDISEKTNPRNCFDLRAKTSLERTLGIALRKQNFQPKSRIFETKSRNSVVGKLEKYQSKSFSQLRGTDFQAFSKVDHEQIVYTVNQFNPETAELMV